MSGVLVGVACSDDPVSPSSRSVTPTTDYEVELESFWGGVYASWGRSATDFYAASDMIVHFDGTTWSLMPLPLEPSRIRGGTLLANGESVFWDYDRVYRSNGSAWDYITAPSDWTAISVLPSGEVFACDYDGVVHHHDGVTWSSETVAPGDGNLRGIDAASADDVFVVGRYGVIAHYDGTAWTTLHVDSTLYLNNIWTSPDGVAYTVAGVGKLSYFDAVLDSLIAVGPDSVYAYDLCGNGNRLYMYGRDSQNAIYSSGGQSWTRTPMAARSSDDLAWGTPDGVVFMTGYYGLWKAGPAGTERVLGSEDFSSVPDPARITAAWTSPEGRVFAVGTGARRLDGNAWVDLNKQAITDLPVTAIHGSADDDVWAVGNGMILHYDGHAWTWVNGAFQRYLHDVWTDGRIVLAVGDNGAILSFNGNGWELAQSPTTRSLIAISGWNGGAVAVGESGTVLRSDGLRWSAVPSPVDWSLYDVAAFGPQRMLAVGDNPRVVLEYRSGTWTSRTIDSYVSHGLNGSMCLVANGMDDYYVGQYGGDIHHFDGTSWTYLPRATMRAIYSIALAPGGDLYAVTTQALLRYRRR
ncbi:MAG TPA: hypothetical protein VFX92_09605 [Candidatus Krumholzibacteria bacterium]|nr:hypothetical protein [Candidatus Krumholzibacteria bacterium]